MEISLIQQQYKNNIIFVPNGRLGNAIFRYLASAVITIKNPSMSYCLQEDFIEATDKFTYYPGLDYEGGDIIKTDSLENCLQAALNNNRCMGYNTLGYLKHTVDLSNLTSNAYINISNGHGLYVKKTVTVNDENFLDLIEKKLEYFNIRLKGYFQFGHIYLKYKSFILNYIEEHKHEHYVQTDLKQKVLMRDLIDDMHLLPEKIYDTVIHIRLDDFKGRPDYIEEEYYLALFKTIDFTGKKVCLLFDPTIKTGDCLFIENCLQWFKERQIPIFIESNNLMIDFNIMKQAKILICSMSTLAWTAAYLSKHIEQCYMPNYNFFELGGERSANYFRQPIENTILYPVKTTNVNLSLIKPYIITLPEYAKARLSKLDNLIQRLSQIGLETNVYNGVHGRDIIINNTIETSIKQLTYRGENLTYNKTIRINGEPMARGEFGAAWSHLNLYKQLLSEGSDTNYYLIFEDDVVLVKPLSELYELLQHVPADMDFCHLALSDWYPFVKTNQVNAYFHECEKRFFNRMTAYIVSKKGAAKLLDYHENAINVPIDDLVYMIFRLTPDFRLYVPDNYYFKERDNTISSILAINKA